MPLTINRNESPTTSIVHGERCRPGTIARRCRKTAQWKSGRAKSRSRAFASFDVSRQANPTAESKRAIDTAGPHAEDVRRIGRRPADAENDDVDRDDRRQDRPVREPGPAAVAGQ